MDDKFKITQVRKNDDGDITEIMLNDGSIYPLEQAINLARDNKLEGVNVGQSRNGTPFLRSNPDNDPNNNLDQLPTF
jgi:hypothetical protein